LICVNTRRTWANEAERQLGFLLPVVGNRKQYHYRLMGLILIFQASTLLSRKSKRGKDEFCFEIPLLLAQTEIRKD